MPEEQLLRIRHAAANYYRQREAEPRHFEAWLSSMNGPMRNYFRRQGFEACRAVPDFRRFAAALDEEGLEGYMREHLSEGDYRAWRRQCGE